jgi:hypothetical protein
LRRLYLFLLILAVSFLLISCKESTPSSPTTTPAKPVVIRETGKGYDKIQQAIDAASPGQHIDVSPDTYDENIKIAKPVYLIGRDKDSTIINSATNDTSTITVEAEAAGFEIRGFTIQNSDRNGIFCTKTSGEISEVIIKDNKLYGMSFNSCQPSLVILKDSIIKDNRLGICCDSDFLVISSCNIKNNIEVGINCCWSANPDVGGGVHGSSGYNVIRNNRGWDFFSNSEFGIKAENNYWDHDTATEIDHFDIRDNEEQFWSHAHIVARVDFEPFLTGEPSASLEIMPRLLTTSFLFNDFFRSIFKADLPVSAIYISRSFETKLHLIRYALIRKNKTLRQVHNRRTTSSSF